MIMATSYPPLSIALLTFIGKKISAVVFVEGYVQIEFPGGRMSIMAQMVLQIDGAVSLDSKADGFASALSSCVGAEVLGVQEQADDLVVRLSNGSTLRINLADPSIGPETFVYEDSEGGIWVA